MPMEPVTTNATVVSAPAPAPSVPTPPPSAPATPSGPVAGASGLPAAPVAPAAVPAPAVTPVDSPELAQIRADRARLEAEVARLQPYARLGYQHSQNPAAPPVPLVNAPSAPKTNVLGVRELDANVQAFLTTDAAGNVVATPDAPPGVLAQYQAHQRELGAALKKLATNPEEALAAVINKAKEDWIKEAKSELTAEQTKAQQAAMAEQIVRKNSDWLFEKDATGNKVVMTDPLTGQSQYKRTEGGEWWATAANRLMQSGVSDPVMIDEYARAHAFFQAWQKSQAAQPAAPAVPPPAPAPAPDMKQAFLNRIPGAQPGAFTPAGSNPPPASNRVPSLRERMLQDLMLAGHTPGSKLPMGIPQAA